MLKKLKHLRHLGKLKPIRNYTNKFIYPSLKFLVFSIILLSFFVVGCEKEDENKAMDEKISRLEKEAEKHIISKVKIQRNYLLKNKNFFIPHDEVATNYGSFSPIFGTQICYLYYTKTDTNILSKTTIDAVYSYGVQDDCGGMFGFELRWYVGASFAVRIPGDKQVKLISIVCQSNDFGRVPSRPEYINGVVKCPSKTTQVLLI